MNTASRTSQMSRALVTPPRLAALSVGVGIAHHRLDALGIIAVRDMALGWDEDDQKERGFEVEVFVGKMSEGNGNDNGSRRKKSAPEKGLLVEKSEKKTGAPS